MMKNLTQRWKKCVMTTLVMLLFLPALSMAQSSTFSINLNRGTLKQFFSAIEKQSDYLFVYVDSDISNVTVSVNVSNKDINETLDAALKTTNLEYRIEGKNISVFKAAADQDKATKGQKKRITGRVTDKNGEALIGVGIAEAGNLKNTTITDADGLYTINATVNSTLVFSYVGFEKLQESTRGSQNVHDVQMSEEVNALNEMVVVGYGQQRKISSIGSQSTLKIQDIKTPSASLSTVLAGRLSGVIAVQRTGEPGKDGADIWIRGIATPNKSTPLILVDGVERSFNDIDPEDIESLTTLKDASATAVYGVRGANGVILIKTKPGNIGRPTVSVDYYESITQFTKKVDLADGITYMNAVNESLSNTKKAAKYDQMTIQNTYNKTDELLYPNVNWMDQLFNDYGRNRRANVNVRGGSQNANYYASVSYYNETGLMKTDNIEDYNSTMKYSRYNFTTNLNLKITESTKLDIGTQGYLGEGNYPTVKSSDVYSSAMDISPVDYPKMFFVNGIREVPGINPNGGYRNPYADATMRGYQAVTRNQIYSNIRLTQDLSMLTKGLNFSTMFAYDVYSYESVSQAKRESTYYFKDKNTPYDENGQPILNQTFTGSSDLAYDKASDGNKKTYLEASLNYDRAFGKHRFGALGLFNQQSKTIYPVNTLEASLPYRMRGIAGRATYSFDDRYFAEFNIGYNGSENFAPESRYGTFPAIGFGWVASNEKFWEPIMPYVSFLKFRYTNGTIGNSEVSDRRFMYLAQYVYDGNFGYMLGNTNNKTDGVRVENDAVDLGWETSHKQDLGIDFKLLNDDLSVIFDLFKEHRTDILLKRNLSIPGFLGYMSDPYGNVGVVDNQGFDASVEYNKKFGKDWLVSVRGNFTCNEDKWVENDQPTQMYPWLSKKGTNVNGIWGYEANGLFTQDELDANKAWDALSAEDKAANKKPYATPYDNLQAGDVKFNDINGDGKIDAYDKKWIGNGDVPKAVYGFGLNVTYKQLSLGILFQGTSGAERMINGSSINPFKGDGGSGNLYSNIYDRWTVDNPSQDVFYPRLAYGSDEVDNQNNFTSSSWWIKDMDFIRLKTMQISYNLPKKWFSGMGFKNVSVYAMGSNLFTISQFKLWDPELNTGNGTSYPNNTTYSAGVNFSF